MAHAFVWKALAIEFEEKFHNYFFNQFNDLLVPSDFVELHEFHCHIVNCEQHPLVALLKILQPINSKYIFFCLGVCPTKYTSTVFNAFQNQTDILLMVVDSSGWKTLPPSPCYFSHIWNIVCFGTDNVCLVSSYRLDTHKYIWLKR